MSAPDFSIFSNSVLRHEKSADRMDGAILIILLSPIPVVVSFFKLPVILNVSLISFGIGFAFFNKLPDATSGFIDMAAAYKSAFTDDLPVFGIEVGQFGVFHITDR